MILTDNANWLIKRYPELWALVCSSMNTPGQINIHTDISKSGAYTMSIEQGSRLVYLHSSYDPHKEAELLLSKYNDAGNYNHVIFYGTGLGYHIEAFAAKYPETEFSIYEPCYEVFLKFMETKVLGEVTTERLKNIFIEDLQDNCREDFEKYMSGMGSGLMIFILPSYEKAFQNRWKDFYQRFGSKIQDKEISGKTRRVFEKAWGVNVMRNFAEITRTYNILGARNSVLRGKPAILVAAGPSLDYELENLRYVKENGLAYIFSVGSAIDTLIDYDILPDAVFSIDPGKENIILIQRLLNRKVNTVPLIFGTSIYHEVVSLYPGIKLHMTMNKDLLSPFCLRFENGQSIESVSDASSVAVTTLELLHKLGCSPIILVGQNMAFKDNRYYAKGIEHNMMTEAKGDDVSLHYCFEVEKVDGGKVLTSKTLTAFRKDMEEVLKRYGSCEVINTTLGGAKIAGTGYERLQSVIESKLMDKVVNPEWTKEISVEYDLKFMKEQLYRLQSDLPEMIKILDDMERVVNIPVKAQSKINYLHNHNAALVLLKSFEGLTQNLFFKVLLYPMNFYQCEVLIKKLKAIDREDSISLKIEKTIECFQPFIENCRSDTDHVIQLFENLKIHLEM